MPTVEQFTTGSLQGCSTAPLRPLDDQIVNLLLATVNTPEETNLVRCDDIPGVNLVGNSTIPLLQPAARESLRQVMEQVGRELSLFHAYRTVAQQFVLLQWRIHGRCDITSARRPGTSDHERGIAIDLDSHDHFSTWKHALETHGWVWAGDGDRGHFSFHGPGVNPNVITESVRSFQRLWNLNNPDDLIDDDGVYGDIETGPRLLLSPIEGFPIAS